jgi:hypothetical protein
MDATSLILDEVLAGGLVFGRYTSIDIPPIQKYSKLKYGNSFLHATSSYTNRMSAKMSQLLHLAEDWTSWQ